MISHSGITEWHYPDISSADIQIHLDRGSVKRLNNYNRDGNVALFTIIHQISRFFIGIESLRYKYYKERTRIEDLSLEKMIVFPSIVTGVHF